MNKKDNKILNQLKSKQNLTNAEERMLRELKISKTHKLPLKIHKFIVPGFYDFNDFSTIQSFVNTAKPEAANLVTLKDLLERDKKREADGFPRRIRVGKFIKPSKDNKEQIIVVPTTTEPKFYHDSSTTEEEETGGSGQGNEGQVIGEQPAQPEEGEGEGTGAGQGEGADHDIVSDAFDLGKILTEKFELPNIKVKGTKRSATKFQYDLTDKNRGFGQILDKKATLKKVIETNILLGNVSINEDFDPENLVINPKDQIFRILSKEKDFEAQAVVFFIRDYSGSMQGKPTEVIATQHLLIYSWLMYQYQNNVQVRFIVHDTEAKEVADFHTYYRSSVSGGTNIYPAYELVNRIVTEEQLAKENNIYIFQGTDGDDWDSTGEKAILEIVKILEYVSRLGITIAKNSWTGFDNETVVEKYIAQSGLLEDKSKLIKLDAFVAGDADESRIIEGIKKIVS
jgi:uncharacterized protein